MSQNQYLGCIPFVRLVVPLGLGIWCADLLGLHSPGLLVLVASLCLVCFALFRRLPSFYRQFGRRWMAGALVFLFLFSCGGALVIVAFPSVYNVPVQVLSEVVIKSQDVTSGGYCRLTVSPVKIQAQRKIPFHSKDLWQIITKETENSGPITYFVGDTLLVRAEIRGGQAVANPEAFDYGRYLFRQGIAGSAFVPGEDIKVIGTGHVSGVSGLMQTIRGKVKHVYQRFGIEENELDVLLALTLGIRDDLDVSVKNHFVRSGAVHILAVSGLHVGVIFLILNAFFSLLLPPRSWAKLLVILLSLWFFAFLTGGAPSVSRAVIMFSIIQIGQFVNRESNIYNLLGASAFIILLVQPTSLFQAGFWLSHLAVAGIVTLYPLVSQIAAGWALFWRWLWSLVAVSLSAQLTTFPLSIFLFKSFPVYFLFSNILVLPLVAPIIFLSLLLILFSSFPFLGRLFAGPLNELLLFMNEMVQWLDGLPGSYLERIWISAPMMVMIYLFLFLLSLFIDRRSRGLVKYALGALAGIFLLLNLHYLIKVNTNSFVVFDAGRQHLIASIMSGKGTMWRSKEMTDQKCAYLSDAFFTKNAFTRQCYSLRRVERSSEEALFDVFPVKSGCFVGVGALDVDEVNLNRGVRVYGVVLLDEVKGDMRRFLKRLNCDELILSPSCPGWWVEKSLDEIMKQGIHVFDVSKEGAFVQHF